ncbi:DEAD/DEAH box helicase [Anaeromyxobacter paludicola]|uniref:ATP-dependent DNA helicase n=1 Tax=Anaeromyxobacter paludicola TaxID=2918171 RepID=A0ABN6NAP9_9BACT|nr:DEAD/DEAH box helicase [Anaeromyxobacter paludicola]BDG09378.1 ATP-dependent DNA helicase [Anaeromyxobacter paludicola]
MLPGFHPLVARWFAARFGAPTEPQAAAWPHILAGEDVLVSAPTGSGKTLAAFLACLDRLVRLGLAGALPEATEVLYVSPLKALGNDIEKNLDAPLAELCEAARAAGRPLPPIRVAVRTGDTPASRRQALLRRPPHVLVTTPESLYLYLTSRRGRAALARVRTVICDEIHAVARDKRGAHLALSLERLEDLTGARPQRIGLSATQDPVDEVARFLVGAGRVGADGAPRCRVVELGRRRPLDLAVEIPRDELSGVASNELWAETWDRVAALVRDHRTTLVFVNTRRLAERAARALEERLGPGQVGAHHGSLSRARRLEAEERLKQGALRAVVATASLELGIDVGAVDLVCQIGSPGSLATGLQRVGRAGHWRGATPRGRLFPLSRDELVECAAFVRGARAGRLEETRVPEAPLDVLAQQLVAEAASRAEPAPEDALFALTRRAWPYRDLPRAEFDAVLAMLAEGFATRRGRAGALLHRDGVHRAVRGRRGARLAALTGAGAIPDSAQYAVVAEPEGAQVGSVDEDFAVETLAGDVFQLGNTSWRVRRVETGTVRVEDAHGQPPGIPFWVAEAPGRSAALSREVSEVRAAVAERLPDREAAARWLAAEGALPEAGARQAVDYLAAAAAALGAMPTQETLVLERFFDEAGGMQVVLHAPFGARQNRALGTALRKRFCRSFDFELQAAATDEGVLLSLGPQHSFPLESLFEIVDARSLDEVLTQAALQAPMFQVRFRWGATRALAIPRLFKGRRTPPNVARMKSDDLLAAVFPQAVACQDNAPGGPLEVPDHPLVKEALRDCLREAMDADGLRALLGRIASGEVRLVARDTPEPSPMSHEVVGARPWAYLDDAPLEERRARAVALRRALPAAEAEALGALDPAAVAEVTAQARPDPRDPDELHDLLLDVVALPDDRRAFDGAAAGWRGAFAALTADGRAARALAGGRTFWVAAERAGAARALLAPERLEPALSPLPGEDLPADRDEAAVRALRGLVPRLGPTTGAALAGILGLPRDVVRDALLRLEQEGLVLRGRFLADAPWSAEDPHWCERGLLARIHRLTLGRLRREIEPVRAADLVRFLLRWQHAAPGTRLHGPRGLAEVVEQLQGFHAAAGAWERALLPARLSGYDPAWLDGLCFSGEVAFGRVALAVAEDEPPRRRSAPTRNAPVTLALREDLPWLAAAAAHPRPPLGPAARQLVDALVARGASFAEDLAAATGRLAAEVEEGLWELVSAGVVTCDGFAGLRALIDPAGRRRRGRAPGGRWWLLRPEGAAGRAGRAADAATVERVSRQYLRRYGVVFRDLLAREAGAPPWRELLPHYRRAEARGELRGGRFVAGFTGEQFALPEAVEAIRAARRGAGEAARVELSAADPLNLVGVLTPGPRVPATLGGRVAWEGGVPVPLLERRASHPLPRPSPLRGRGDDEVASGLLP